MMLALSAVEGLLALTALQAPETFTHRVTGLFSPEREAALREAVAKLPDVELVKVNFERAEVELRYDAAALYKGVKEKDRVQRLDQLLKQNSRHTFGARPPLEKPWDSLRLVEIPVSVLDCQGCELAAYEILAKTDGVEYATASAKDGRVRARIDSAKTSREALVEALKKRQVSVKAN